MTIPLKFGPFLALKMMTDSAPVLHFKTGVTQPVQY